MKNRLSQIFQRFRAQALGRAQIIGKDGTGPSVYLAVPSYESRPMANLLNLAWHFQEHGSHTYQRVFPALKPVAFARNKIVDEFMKGVEIINGDGKKTLKKFDYLLMIDDDIVPPEDLWKMVHERKDIIAAAAPAWIRDRIVWVNFEFKEGEGYKQSAEVLKQLVLVHPDERYPVRVDAVGTGCIAIHRRVFEHPEVGAFNPFLTLYDERGQETVGEDLNFCKKASDAGFEIWADPRFVCHHFRTDMDLRAVAMYGLEMYHRGLEKGVELEVAKHIKSPKLSLEVEKERQERDRDDRETECTNLVLGAMTLL